MERYRILKKMAEGGSGETFLVWDKHLEKEWVMKCIHLKYGSKDTKWKREAAEQEIRVLRQLRVKGIPMLIDAFYEKETMCLILEYMRGISLEEKIKRDGVMKDTETIFYGLSLTGILRQMHERNVPLIHGDIKPLNIIWQEDGLSLLDFGTASFAYGEAGESGGKCHTPAYAAPELLKGEKMSMASDIYAFGAVLAYMLSGISPEKRKGRFVLREELPKLCPVLEEIILKCIQNDPMQRYHSIAETEQALREAEKRICRKKTWGTWKIWKKGSQKAGRRFQIVESVLLTDGKCDWMM